MEPERAQASLRAAELCLAQGLLDSAVNRAYFALFQAAICALEHRGIRRREWTHKGVHSDFVQLFVRRRKLVPCACEFCWGITQCAATWRESTPG
jgi:uncharacterized protein (UPF0332 family)